MNKDDLKPMLDNIGSRDEIVITRKSKEKTPPYSVIGNGKTSKDYKEDVVVDTIDMIGKMNSQQFETFKYFRDLVVEEQLHHHKRNTTNEEPNIVIIPKSKNDTKAVRIKELIRNNNNGKKLQEMGAIRKIKAGEYMVNPYMIIPSHNFSKAALKWDSLEAKED